jgi:hypothetical protein
MHMSDEAAALAETNVGEDDYQAFCAVLAASARGRAFLAEHARRARQAEIDTLLETLKRLENRMAAQAQAAPPERALQALAGLLEALRGLQAQIDLQRMSADMAKLSGLIDSVRVRLEDIVREPARAASPEAPPAVATATTAAPVALALSAVAAQAIATKAEEPELRLFKAGSIPKPPRFAGDDFAGDVGPTEDAGSEDGEPAATAEGIEVTGAEPASTAQEDDSGLVRAGDSSVFESYSKTSAEDEAASAAPDPLAPILTLTDEERLALFA